MTKTSIFIIGTRGLNGEEFVKVDSRAEAEKQLKEYLLDGFAVEDLICVEGFERQVSAETKVVVDSIRIR